jgi:mannose-6-phosphate isomerase
LPGIGILKNIVKDYSWGSRYFIQELLGETSSGCHPAAEMWMGTHPGGPSKFVNLDGEIPLADLIKRDPVGILGRDVSSVFKSTLPFMFKVIAAANPLSIQVHPDRVRAREGFLRENCLGIPIDSPQRSYKDAFHKPEILCALSEFHALVGLRPTVNTLELLKNLSVSIETDDIAAPGRFFRRILTMDRTLVGDMVRRTAETARELADMEPVFEWIARLSCDYPDDPGCLVPALLNLITLRPGDAIYVPPGEPHVYLGGSAIEVMANSDNVLRGGLTSKHVDIDEFVDAIRWEEKIPAVLTPRRIGPCEMQYRAPAKEFILSVIHVDGKRPYTGGFERSVEIHLCVGGEGVITGEKGSDPLRFRKGQSFLVPASVKTYTIEGAAKLYKVAVPFIRP